MKIIHTGCNTDTHHRFILEPPFRRTIPIGSGTIPTRVTFRRYVCLGDAGREDLGW